MLKDLGVRRTSAWTRDDYKQPEQEARASGVKPFINSLLGEPALTGPIRGKKPRRWVVERTNRGTTTSEHYEFRSERIADHYLGLVHLACALITVQAVGRS